MLPIVFIIVASRILAIYLEQVWPSKIGVQKHPLFFLSAFRSKPASDVVSPKDEDVPIEGADVKVIRAIAESPEQSDSEIVIRVRGLRKEFPTGRGKENFVAVKNLSMYMKRGELEQ